MKPVKIILTMAVSLKGQIKKPGDEVEVDKNLAAQLIANGRAKLPELPKETALDAAAQDKAVADAEKASKERIEAAEKLAKGAEEKALKQIEDYEGQVAKAEKEAHEKIEAHQKAVDETKAKEKSTDQTEKKTKGT